MPPSPKVRTARPKTRRARAGRAELARGRAADLLQYIDRSPTPYHAVAETARRLDAAGFAPLAETEAWSFRAGDRRYVIKNGSTIIAFVIGAEAPARAGFRMVGAHTDSPNLKIKPRPEFTKQGYRQLGVEVYGSPILATWLDRDLSIAGRVAVEGRRGLELRLVDLARPLLRIPNLAIHLNRDVNREGLKINAQTQLPPVLALEAKADGEPRAKRGEGDRLQALLAAALEVPAAAIVDHDLSLYDLQKGAFSGLEDEFIQAARLDNLASCHAALEALIATADARAGASRLIALYDHEEVGSRSAQGAAGPALEWVLARIVAGHAPEEAQGFARAMAASFFVSADMAHAVHPSHADKHEPQHMPVIGRGPVIKSNASQSYATDGESAAAFAAFCRAEGFTAQSYVVRSDLPCGSTIGPITAARLGVRTVDVGNPMLSMHSIREMAGTDDVERLHRVLARFLGAAAATAHPRGRGA